MNIRSQAAHILAQVLHHQQSLNQLLEPVRKKITKTEDKAFFTELVLGTLRNAIQLEHLAKEFLDKPLTKKNADVQALILLGLYQIYYLKVPDHAAVAETVNACQKPWAKKLINAVLRNALRKPDLLEQMANNNNNESFIYAHPQWFIDTLKKDWPAHWQQVLQANNKAAGLCLRVNLSKISRDEYQKLLTQQDIKAIKSDGCESALILESSLDPKALPGFAEGLVSVQDLGAQCATQLLDLQPNLRVLDACAAPGGKTCAILEQQSDLKALIAVEADQQRTQRIQENLQRLELLAKVICADANETASWWDGETFDRILLDVPCSATGVIRRHPDIKFLRRAEDIQELRQQQLSLLKNTWPLLKSGGLLLYVTCSVLLDENERVINQFLKRQADAKALPINTAWGLPLKLGRQLLPGMDNTDGFYYCQLTKN